MNGVIQWHIDVIVRDKGLAQKVWVAGESRAKRDVVIYLALLLLCLHYPLNQCQKIAGLTRENVHEPRC